jgi:hypothetical protein
MTALAWFRTILGFLVAPISPGVLAVLLTAPFHGSDAFSRDVPAAVWIIGLSAVLGYPTAIAFGVPFYILLRWRGWNGLLVYVLAGALLGFIVYLIYLIVVLSAEFSVYSLRQLAERTLSPLIPAGMICGAVAGTTFWLIARPDCATVSVIPGRA